MTAFKGSEHMTTLRRAGCVLLALLTVSVAAAQPTPPTGTLAIDSAASDLRAGGYVAFTATLSPHNLDKKENVRIRLTAVTADWVIITAYPYTQPTIPLYDAAPVQYVAELFILDKVKGSEVRVTLDALQFTVTP